MKVTLSSVRKLDVQLQDFSYQLIQQTMRDNDMGLKDAYEKCNNAYVKKYGYPMPKPY
jgi:hypothetical protein